MTVLMTRLETTQTQVKVNNKALILLAPALFEARWLPEDNPRLHTRINQQDQIIRHIREPDARKNCWYRGLGS